MRWGRCHVCRLAQTVLRHHIVYEQHVRREGGDPWDLRNAMDIGTRCACHRRHHSGKRRIRRSRLPPAALEFANELLGRARAELYWQRYYEEG